MDEIAASSKIENNAQTVKRRLAPVLILLSTLLVVYAVKIFVGFAGQRGAIAVIYDGAGFERMVGIVSWPKLNFKIDDRMSRRFSTDRLSARFTGWLHVPETADYRFIAFCEGGMKMYIGDELVLDKRFENPGENSRVAVTKNLTSGRHSLLVEFYGSLPDARFRAEWEGGPIPPQTIIGARHLSKRYSGQEWGSVVEILSRCAR